MASAEKTIGTGNAPRVDGWRRWLPAAALSVALHTALVPGVVDYVSGRLEPTTSSLPALVAHLEPELPRPPVSPEPSIRILEPQEESPPADSAVVPLPTTPDLVLPLLNDPPRLAMNDIRFPESAFGEQFVSPGTPTRPDGPSARPRVGRATTEKGAPAAPDTTPLAPIFPAEPPHAFLDDLPSAAVRLGETRTVFGDRSEEELRRRVYEGTYYPEAAADLELEGVVIVGFRVDGEGQPSDLGIANPEECHPILQEEALSMVRGGGPYPVPETRRDIEVTVALAYLNTPEVRAERVRMLLSSGAAAVDQHARQMAAQDAARDDRTGWRLVLYRTRARVAVRPGRQLVSPRLESFDGDSRLKRVFVESLPQLLPREQTSARLKIPIQFRILDP